MPPALSRLLSLLLVASAAVSLSGCRGRAVNGPFLQQFSRYVTLSLVRLGVISEGTLVDVGLILLGILALLVTACGAGAYYISALDDDTAPNRFRHYGGTAFLLVGGLVCTGLVFGGSVPERSHWVGGGLLGFVGIVFVTIALAQSSTANKLLFGALAAATFTAQGWWLTMPPADEDVADRRLSRRGFETTRERVDGESHVVRVSFDSDDDAELKRGDASSLVADLRRLPHLKKVSFSSRAAGLPDSVFDQLFAALPGVELSTPFGYLLRQLEQSQNKRRLDRPNPMPPPKHGDP